MQHSLSRSALIFPIHCKSTKKTTYESLKRLYVGRILPNKNWGRNGEKEMARKANECLSMTQERGKRKERERGGGKRTEGTELLMIPGNDQAGRCRKAIDGDGGGRNGELGGFIDDDQIKSCSGTQFARRTLGTYFPASCASNGQLARVNSSFRVCIDPVDLQAGQPCRKLSLWE